MRHATNWATPLPHELRPGAPPARFINAPNELGRDIANGKQAREIMKIGTWYDSVNDTLFNLGLRDCPLLLCQAAVSSARVLRSARNAL